MSAQTIDLTEEWLQSCVSNVSSTSRAVVLIQGYPSTGFAVVTKDFVDWNLAPEGASFYARYSSDVRMFGDLGEWHCWAVGGGIWNARFANAHDQIWEERLPDRQLVLWGTGIDKEKQKPGWTCFIETRGVKLWVPIENAAGPVFLPVWERLETENDTGLAYVKDAMLRPLATGEL